MKLTFARLTLALLAVSLAACAPAVTAQPAPEALPAATTVITPAGDSAVADPQAVATSRGPNLEATDPSTVSLASGGLQLVEFFRFT